MFSSRSKPSRVRFSTFYRHFSLQFTLLCALTGDSWGNRTPVAGVRGRSLNRLTNEPFTRGQRLLCSIASVLVHHQGLEPGTPWLRVRCSTNWANGAYPLCSALLHPENWIKNCRWFEHLKPNQLIYGQASDLLVLPSSMPHDTYTRSLSTS